MTTTERDRLIVLEEKVNGIDKKLDKIIVDHEERLRCLESKPGKMWGILVAASVTGIVGACIGAMFAIFVK
jgi:hypothetical protein